MNTTNFRGDYRVIILLDASPISEVKEKFGKSKITNVEFTADNKYFDVPKNFWTMKNFGKAVDQAVSLCKKGKDLSMLQGGS